jgi:hypothetical protein
MAEDAKVTQQQLVIEMLREAGSLGITSLDALRHAGCFRLASIVHRLRRDGYVIVTEDYTTDTGKNIARYVLLYPTPRSRVEVDYVQAWWGMIGGGN